MLRKRSIRFICMELRRNGLAETTGIIVGWLSGLTDIESTKVCVYFFPSKTKIPRIQEVFE